MQLATLTYTREAGWSATPFPPLDSERTLIVVFGAAAFAHLPEPIAELRAAYPRSAFTGCSTAGEIFQRELADETLSVAIARFDHTDIHTAQASVAEPADSFEAGRSLALELTREDLTAILVLSDGLNVNGSELVRGLNSELDESVIVTGGLAGDGDRFKETWVLDDGRPRPRAVTAAALYGGRVRIGHGSRGGWDIFGPERTVTRSRDNVLFELDGRPALALYKEYLGERASGLPATALRFPLALRARGGDSKLLVRTVLAVDERDQSMTFAGNVPEGHKAQLMRANFERLIEGASEAALRAKGDDAHAGTLAIAISCVGRRLILGERAEEEIEAVLDELPSGTRQIGFYSYGEIAPYAAGYSDLHNQTMTLTTIAED